MLVADQCKNMDGLEDAYTPTKDCKPEGHPKSVKLHTDRLKKEVSSHTQLLMNILNNIFYIN